MHAMHTASCIACSLSRCHTQCDHDQIKVKHERLTKVAVHGHAAPDSRQPKAGIRRPVHVCAALLYRWPKSRRPLIWTPRTQYTGGPLASASQADGMTHVAKLQDTRSPSFLSVKAYAANKYTC